MATKSAALRESDNLSPVDALVEFKRRLTMSVLGPAGDTRKVVFALLSKVWWNRGRRYVVGALPEKRCNFVAMTMVKNSDRYLVDWLRFHWAGGVEHFFIYINESRRESVDRIFALVRDAGFETFVTLMFWPDAPSLVRYGEPSDSRSLPTVHESAAMHFWKNYGHLASYYMKLDSDEYVFRTDFADCGLDLRPLLNFEGNLLVKGYNFGSSGAQRIVDGSDPCRFTWRERNVSWQKSIAHAPTTREFFNMHAAFVEAGISSPEPKPLQINHYRLRSKEEFLANKMHVRGSIGENYVNVDFDSLDALYSEIEDRRACEVAAQSRELWEAYCHSTTEQ